MEKINPGRDDPNTSDSEGKSRIHRLMEFYEEKEGEKWKTYAAMEIDEEGVSFIKPNNLIDTEHPTNNSTFS